MHIKRTMASIIVVDVYIEKLFFTLIQPDGSIETKWSLSSCSQLCSLQYSNFPAAVFNEGKIHSSRFSIGGLVLVGVVWRGESTNFNLFERRCRRRQPTEQKHLSKDVIRTPTTIKMTFSPFVVGFGDDDSVQVENECCCISFTYTSSWSGRHPWLAVMIDWKQVDG